MLLIRDVTTEVRHRLQLEQAQKMEAAGLLASGIAHDFNNMLGVVLGYAEILEAQLHDRPKLAKYAAQIYHASERGSQLTSNLLSFSTKQPKQHTSQDINQLITDVKAMLHQSLTARIELNFKFGVQLWPVKTDAGAFEDMMLNMSINAMHAMPNGGQLNISTNNEQLSGLVGAKLNLPDGDYVCLIIEDTGCGISEGVKTKIFDPYFTTKGKGGSGLGLSQVYGFIHACGGAIDVFSQPGLGSRFVLYFPRQAEFLTPQTTPDSPRDQNLNGSETILVVDDEPSLVELARNILTSQGYQVYCASDGEQALAILASHSVDLLLSDIIMPKMNGYQLLE
ncbi:MAG: response regulator, partial [Psychrosphaera sp.]|nr:response regulator [Psychrosphaera sp.]